MPSIERTTDAEPSARVAVASAMASTVDVTRSMESRSVRLPVACSVMARESCSADCFTRSARMPTPRAVST